MMRVALLLVWVSLACAESPAERVSAAAALVQSGRYESAVVGIRAGLKQFPETPDLWNLLGICESELQNLNEARSAFERGIALAPGAIGLNENLGLLFFRQNDYT